MYNNLQNFTRLDSEVTPKNDIAFKRIFGAKGNEEILKDFLEAILNIKIASLSTDVTTEFAPDYRNGKSSRLDVRTKLADGTNVNIEVQTNMKGFSEQRCLQYWSKIYSNNISASEKYEELPKVICIWILDGEVYEEFEDFMSKWEMTEEKHGTKGHFKEIEFHIIELKKFRNSATIKKNVINFWLSFIDYTNKELVELACISNEKIQKAREELAKIEADKELMERIRLEELAEFDQKNALCHAREEGEQIGLEKGEQIGMEKGEQIGLQKGKKEIVKNMLKANMTIEQISQMTELSKDEILKIEKELNEK